MTFSNNPTSQAWLKRAREKDAHGNQLTDDRDIAEHISVRSPDSEFAQRYLKFKSVYGDDPNFYTSILNHTAFGTSQIDEVDFNDELPTMDGLVEQKEDDEQGFFGRLGESFKSAPERLQRGFGSEEVREGREETSKGFDLADLPGDVADIIGPALPVLGSIGGGLIGGGAAIPTGLGAIAGASAGAAAGAGALETGRQAIGNILNVEDRFGEGRDVGDPLFDLGEAGKEAVLGGVGEFVGGQLIARPAAKLLRPFAKRFSPDIANIAKRLEIDLPVSSVSDSPIVELGEATAGKGFFGDKIAGRVTKATEKLTALSDDLVKKVGASDDLATAGKNITEGLDAYREAWMVGKRKVYDDVGEALSKKLIVSRTKDLIPNTKNTISLLDEVISEERLAGEVLGEGFDTSLLKTIKNNLSKGKSFKEIDAAMKKLSDLSKFGGKDVVATGNPAIFRKIAATLDDDVMQWLKGADLDSYTKLLRADKFYSEGIEQLNGAIGRSIKGVAVEPEQVLNKVIRPKKPEQAARAIELMLATEGGERRLLSVQAGFTRKLLDEAIGTTDDITGIGLKRVLSKYGDDTIKTVLGDDTLKVLKEYSKVAQAIADSQRIVKGSQTLFLSKLVGAISAFTSGKLGLGAAIVSGDAILTTIFNTALGRKWLTEGLITPLIGKAGKAAFRPVGQAISNQFD